jgi:hypothetical protein
MKRYYFFILTLFSNAFSEVAIGDTFVLSAGYETVIDGGTTVATEVLDSIKISADTTFYIYSVKDLNTIGFFEDGRTMSPLIKDSNRKKLAILSSKPKEVVKLSQDLSGSKWIIGSLSDFLFYPDLLELYPTYFIPILPEGTSFQNNDFYVIRVNDTFGIQWVADNPLYGGWYFFSRNIKYQDSADTVGQIDSATVYNGSYWISSNDNPFSLNSVGAGVGRGFYSITLSYKKLNPASVVNLQHIRPHLQFIGKTTSFDLLGRAMGSSPIPNYRGLIIIKQSNNNILRQLRVQ